MAPRPSVACAANARTSSSSTSISRPDVTRAGAIAWDGFLILDWLRRIDEVRRRPIIFITSVESTKFRERAMSAGAIAFFQKPIDQEEMLSVIRHTIGDPPELTQSRPMGF